jgi:hypothetical protein
VLGGLKSLKSLMPAAFEGFEGFQGFWVIARRHDEATVLRVSMFQKFHGHCEEVKLVPIYRERSNNCYMKLAIYRV